MKRCAVVFALLWILCATASASVVLTQREFKMKQGDDPRWASPQWRDGDWTSVRLYEMKEHDDVVWLRARVRITSEHLTPGHPVGISFAAMASHEIYWDGVLIGRGGVPGRSPAAEIPGPLHAHYVIPDRLSQPGQHVVALRTSAHHRHFRPAAGYWFLQIGDYDKLLNAGSSTTLPSLASLSGMMVVAIFALLLFIADRSDRSYLLLSCIGVVGSLLLIAEAWRNLFGYTYNYHLLRLVIITALTALLNLSLLLFAIVRFPGSGSRWFLLFALLGFVGSLSAHGWDAKSLFMFYTGIGLSFLWTLRAAYSRHAGALLATIGFGVTGLLLFWRPVLFADLNLYFGLDFLFLCLLASHVMHVRRVRAQREEALIKSSRLEVELMKKYIQPHYLLNTLTALAEWIEQEPKKAAKMVQELSEEFRLLSQVSHRSLITLEEELRLCRSHLHIMSRRKGRSFALSAQNNLENSTLVPPAIFHTVVENAVIHNKHNERHVEFKLSARRESGSIHYTFTAPIGDTDIYPDNVKEGTGIRYIKARLRESYGDSWKFDSRLQGDVWRTDIWIPAG